MLERGRVIDVGDHSVEILQTPAETGDRYRLRIEADPGGPGIKGDFPHIHPTLLETFACVSGDMLVKLGRDVRELPVGQQVSVPPGSVHGFLNTGRSTLVVDSEVIFPEGYDPSKDLMDFAGIYDELRQRGPTNKRTGEPPLLQMAVLTHAFRASIMQPGLAGILMGPLAAIGRARGYEPTAPRAR